MAQTTVILSVVALVLIMVNAKTGKQLEGLKLGLMQLCRSLPLILGAFILAGMIEVLIPAEFVQSWLSKEAGLKGILLGSFGGMILAMGPYASFPIMASILASGAGLGTMVSMIAGWAILGLSKAPFETAFFGVKFFAYKLIFSIPFCLAAGLIAHVLELVWLA
jgi:uncharacterized membrane protein YraQ (UPF0718 family)